MLCQGAACFGEAPHRFAWQGSVVEGAVHGLVAAVLLSVEIGLGSVGAAVNVDSRG